MDATQNAVAGESPYPRSSRSSAPFDAHHAVEVQLLSGLIGDGDRGGGDQGEDHASGLAWRQRRRPRARLRALLQLGEDELGDGLQRVEHADARARHGLEVGHVASG